MDLISRQAAIQAILDMRDCYNGFSDTYDKAEIIGMLEEVPPAQPEIIRCKDCKHYNAGFECLIEGYGIERSADWYCADAERRCNE